jgi:hypothetical protein
MRPRSHRLARLALAPLLLLAPLLAPAAGLDLVRVWPEYRSASSFVRLGEYFGASERSSELILRSNPEDRSGYYFLARFRSEDALPGAILAVEYILPGEELAQVRFFNLDLPRGSRAILAGLTGADWPSAEITPTAWRLRLLAADGAELARAQSFLWSLPPAAETPAASPAS